MKKPELTDGWTPQPDEIWTELDAFGLTVVRLVEVHSQHARSGVYRVSAFPGGGLLYTVRRRDLGKRVENEMEILAWASK